VAATALSPDSQAEINWIQYGNAGDWEPVMDSLAEHEQLLRGAFRDLARATDRQSEQIARQTYDYHDQKLRLGYSALVSKSTGSESATAELQDSLRAWTLYYKTELETRPSLSRGEREFLAGRSTWYQSIIDGDETVLTELMEMAAERSRLETARREEEERQRAETELRRIAQQRREEHERQLREAAAAEFSRQQRQREQAQLEERARQKHERYWNGAGALTEFSEILSLRAYLPVEDGLSQISEHLEICLAESQYPEPLPTDTRIEYSSDARLVLIEVELPDTPVIPKYRDYQYIQSRDEWKGLKLPEGERKSVYNSVLCQIALRRICEAFAATTPEAVRTVALNGYVTSVDRATGHPIRPCVLSIQVSREQFEAINLDDVDPRKCFKWLKGVAAANLADLAPVAPLIKFDTTDKRFIASTDVASSIDSGTNLAAMDWQEFEHLIRELFEWEFSAHGGEVKVTRASRDHGVDAIAFDPDPIRGGKIVIQAKRYTNTVELSAVRDLYGTVMNEGANKGILITTTDYGADAYDFAKGKPLTLLNGGNLLHLLEKHGRKAHIDVAAAKKLLGG
jgi:restriction system protein